LSAAAFFPVIRPQKRECLYSNHVHLVKQDSVSLVNFGRAGAFKRVGEEMDGRNELKAKGATIDQTAQRVAELMGVPLETVWGSGRYRPVVRPRSLLCYRVVRELGISMSDMTRRIRVSVPTVGKSVRRGEEIANACRFKLDEELS